MPRYQVVPHQHHRRDVVVRCGNRRELVDARTIRAYLPDAFLSIRQDEYLDLDQYVTGCPGIAAGLITTTTMLRVCEEILDILGYNPGDGQEAQLAFSDQLARAVIEDRRRGHTSGDSRYPESIAIFMTLADMSREFGSRRLASLCHSFFSSHGHRIVQAERSRAIILWSWAILMSKMTEAEQIECLREIARVRPDMALSSRYDDYISIPGMKEVKTSFLRIVQYENSHAVEGRHRKDYDDGMVLVDKRERRVGHRRRPTEVTVQRRARVLDSWPVEHKHHHLIVRDGGVSRALRDVNAEQRHLRHDMQHVRQDLEDINHKVDKLGWDDARRRDWKHYYPDCWPDVDEYEWFEESWDDYY
ncbi:hypothetical protein IWX90DRAFT_301884 [Phyllosticta citrichinensis]|uniref:Uncharacterized protein n=1 Tax=Phyllosticta citrichinensis TaxID=1130410 RepID=A0ABR1XL69_9PEZI